MNALAGGAVVLAGLTVCAFLAVLGACIADANPGIWDAAATGRDRTVTLAVDAPRGAIVRDSTGRRYRVLASAEGRSTCVPA